MKIQRPNIKINRTWLMLIIAVVLSLLTTWLTLQYLKFKEKSIEQEIAERNNQKQGELVAVVVPIKALPPGTILDESVVASRPVPADFIYDDTITQEQFDAYKGQALLHPVQRGRPLRKSDVQEVFADFSGSLKEGTRAMTIEVDEINSVSHMIEPGNRVDLMLVMSGGNEAAPGAQGAGGQSVVPFLEQVKVLATGQKITHDDPAEGDAGDHRRSYGNLTLEVTPTQAARLALATEVGKIRAVLRNEKDKEEVDFESVTAANLLDDILERQRRIARSRPRNTSSGEYVEYIIGGRGSDSVAPTMNVPMPIGLGAMPAQAGVPPTADASAIQQGALPQSLTDLIKLGTAANNSKAAKNGNSK